MLKIVSYGGKEAAVPKSGQEVLVRAGHQHAGGEGVQLDGSSPQQEEAQPFWRECDDAAFFER